SAPSQAANAIGSANARHATDRARTGVPVLVSDLLGVSLWRREMCIASPRLLVGATSGLPLSSRAISPKQCDEGWDDRAWRLTLSTITGLGEGWILLDAANFRHSRARVGRWRLRARRLASSIGGSITGNK